MRPVVLDTDVSSRALKNRLAGPLAARLIGATWCVTFVTVAELWQWAEIRHWGHRTRDQLDDWLAHVVVLDSAEAVSRAVATLNTKDFADFAEHDGLVLLPS